MRDILKGTSVTVTEERATRIKPILKWIKEGAPRKRERDQAARILKGIEGIKDWRQVILTRGEVELLVFVEAEASEVVGEKSSQLSLFSLLDRPTATASRVPKVVEEGPVLKTELTKEEQEERDETIGRLGYKPKPQSYFEAEMRARREE